jgi:hypothetical protein
VIASHRRENEQLEDYQVLAKAISRPWPEKMAPKMNPDSKSSILLLIDYERNAISRI